MKCRLSVPYEGIDSGHCFKSDVRIKMRRVFLVS